MGEKEKGMEWEKSRSEEKRGWDKNQGLKLLHVDSNLIHSLPLCPSPVCL